MDINIRPVSCCGSVSKAAFPVSIVIVTIIVLTPLVGVLVREAERFYSGLEFCH